MHYFVVLTKKKPRFGAIPTINMPKKSHDTPKPSPRQPLTRTINTEEKTKVPQSCYKTFNDFTRRLSNIKSLNQWNMRTLEDKVVLSINILMIQMKMGNLT